MTEAPSVGNCPACGLSNPSAEAVRRLRAKLRDTVRCCYGANAATLVKALASIVRGWAAYLRSQVSSKLFSQLDTYLWTPTCGHLPVEVTYKWATRSHPNKPKRWVVGQYFGRFATSSNDRLIFGDRTTGAFVPRFAWTKIERHVAVNFRASPDDPDFLGYWADRRRKKKPPLNATRLNLLRQQDCRCATCGDFLLHADCEPQTPSQW